MTPNLVVTPNIMLQSKWSDPLPFSSKIILESTKMFTPKFLCFTRRKKLHLKFVIKIKFEPKRTGQIFRWAEFPRYTECGNNSNRNLGDQLKLYKSSIFINIHGAKTGTKYNCISMTCYKNTLHNVLNEDSMHIIKVTNVLKLVDLSYTKN